MQMGSGDQRWWEHAEGTLEQRESNKGLDLDTLSIAQYIDLAEYQRGSDKQRHFHLKSSTQHASVKNFFYPIFSSACLAPSLFIYSLPSTGFIHHLCF